jgi:hypothetical protein
VAPLKLCPLFDSELFHAICITHDASQFHIVPPPPPDCKVYVERASFRQQREDYRPTGCDVFSLRYSLASAAWTGITGNVYFLQTEEAHRIYGGPVTPVGILENGILVYKGHTYCFTMYSSIVIRIAGKYIAL